ncbi:YfiR family protein [Vibrio sp. JC009]|uniref:YfiR family protein n=1 Tax=Vibrio sp. JC009 TaxID=2912314 RepID=UPI0023B05865|nr:YfiR family protein [Vibrio sp. JC009]WED24706.1 YfiR family protein [Vibrio sp. JC009]
MGKFKVKLINVLTLLGMSMMLTAGIPLAATKTLAELKAAYIYNIGRFTRWPEWKLSSADAALNICLFGENDVVQALSAMYGRTLGMHPIQISYPDKVHEFEACHMLYVSPAESRRYRYILQQVAGRGVVTISDNDKFMRSGGIINLVERSGKLRFEIDKNYVHKQPVEFSSKLLKLGILIDGSR